MQWLESGLLLSRGSTVCLFGYVVACRPAGQRQPYPGTIKSLVICMVCMNGRMCVCVTDIIPIVSRCMCMSSGVDRGRGSRLRQASFTWCTSAYSYSSSLLLPSLVKPTRVTGRLTSLGLSTLPLPLILKLSPYHGPWYWTVVMGAMEFKKPTFIIVQHYIPARPNSTLAPFSPLRDGDMSGQSGGKEVGR